MGRARGASGISRSPCNLWKVPCSPLYDKDTAGFLGQDLLCPWALCNLKIQQGFLVRTLCVLEASLGSDGTTHRSELGRAYATLLPA